MYYICFLFFLFYCYSIFGWFVECTYCSIMERKLICNRGFLIGPYCSIYGLGALYMFLFLERYYNDPIVLFVMALFGTSLIEYMTSLCMEKLFKARWWDYSHVRFNIEGRVCLKNAIAFGLLGVLFIYVLNPYFLVIVDKIPNTILIIISIILAITYLIDNIITFIIMMKLKEGLTNLRKDSTADLDKQIREILSQHRFLTTKLLKSFPRVKFKLPLGEKILVSIQRTLDALDTAKKERRKKLKHK